MPMDRLLPSFLDELEKIAVTSAYSPFQQTRRGRRPIRAHTLLNNENMRDRADEQAADREKPPVSAVEYEGGAGVGEGPYAYT